MSRYTKIFAALVIGGSSIAMVAAAPPVDSNGDGIVTRAEYNAAAAKQFAATDTNSDGVWTEIEIRKAQRGGQDTAYTGLRKHLGFIQAKAAQAQAHHNLSAEKPAHSNVVTQGLGHPNDKGTQIDPDITEGQKYQLGGIDTNGDGYISKSESAAARQAFQDRGYASLGGSSVFDSSGREGLVLRRMDKDSDGTISRTEFIDLSNERFGNYDTNKDGQLSNGENTQQPVLGYVKESQVLTPALRAIKGVSTRDRLEHIVRQQRQHS